MRRIAIEEHFFTEAYLDYLRSRKEHPRLEGFEDEDHRKIERMWRSPTHYLVFSPQKTGRLVDMGSGRLREMDKAGIDMQVLSMSGPSVDELDVSAGTAMAKEVNDELARKIKMHPERFAGFAALSPGDPQGAADELKRAVRELGLRGAKINSHIAGEYLDDKKYWVIFEMAEKLGVPIYLHPKEPPEGMLKLLAPYPAMMTAVWGFAADAGLHTMRLILSGLFDVYPKLKIILGHMGEGIPFWLWRIDTHWMKRPHKNIRRKPSDYFKDNFFVTTSGMFWEPSFLCTYLALGADRILFAVDYPSESNEEAVAFMDALPICDRDKDKIY
ncbi:MAG: hypothetical protein A2170_15115, partial [Deltaproteobacteria bacterium RBG_13_53_10]